MTIFHITAWTSPRPISFLGLSARGLIFESRANTGCDMERVCIFIYIHVYKSVYRAFSAIRSVPKGVTLGDITGLQCLGSPSFTDFVSSNLNIVVRKQSLKNKRGVGSRPQVVDKYPKLIPVFILEKTLKVVIYGQDIYLLQSVIRVPQVNKVKNEVIGRIL